MPPAILVARRLKERGHDVLLVSDEANRSQANQAGLAFTAWVTAPNRLELGQANDPLNEWRTAWPPAIVRAVCDAVICGPASDYARDTLSLIDTFDPDVVVTNELLFGAMLAAERAAIPLAVLTANVWCYPTRADLPPFGPGFPPAVGRFQQGRERTTRALIARWYDAGLPALNAARQGLGLPLLRRVLDQLRTPDLILLGASRAFDYDARPPPAFLYAGPLIEAPAWVSDGGVEDLIDPGRPNVLVSFSTTYQAQEEVLRRCIEALARLPVHGIVTLGPAIDGSRLPTAANVTVVQSASHDLLVPRCAAMLCHGGHGTAIRPIMHGVPLVCIPTGRDQPENAERIAWAGAGLRLRPNASVAAIAKAVQRVIGEAGFRQAAGVLGRAVAEEADGGSRAADAIEAVTAQRSRMV